jgi:hypothetical protein
MVDSKSQDFVQKEKGKSNWHITHAVEFEKFKSALGTVIASFEKAKEWADLSNCL